MRDKNTFHGTFGKTFVTISVDYAALENGADVAQCLRAEWKGEKNPAVIPQYVEWMHTVLSHVAKRVNKKILHAYPPYQGHGPVFHVYHADGTHEAVPRIPDSTKS